VAIKRNLLYLVHHWSPLLHDHTYLR